MPNLDCFEALECGLQEIGLYEDASWLRQTRTDAYTTSSEMLGELGAMVRRIHKVIPDNATDNLTGIFSDCELAVRLVWPEYNLTES
ncbi:hypothetical protein Pla108_37460 [Botrimarina colliarenosi]|uniref:Uncharacterized protein n=1 Tax=Botrimarina colliarenosi TaxID=2528001 RepID=A0A5C6A3T9_9BACT|nr:hypothetical protein [Botrimarina colliarenosi]TWT94035.1 hypothetical protein Pla108_37460 [Botrimarina colliarenosi]